jgi:hypothetical protein
MLEVSRDAAAAGEEQLISCAAEQSKYYPMCTVTLDPCGDLPFTSWGRWLCLRGGADGLISCYAACGCGTEYMCWGPAGGRRAATCLRRWRALPLRSPTRRWRALPLAEMVPFHSTQAAGQNSRESYFGRRFEFVLEGSNEHSEQARTPHTNGPRDVPRCGALSLLQKTLHYKGG